MIAYYFIVVEADGSSVPPSVAWPTSEQARDAAVSFLADRVIEHGDELLAWEAHHDRADGLYPVFTAPTKYGRQVRVQPIELITLCR